MTEPYGVGTVSVANGGTTVTGTGTFWVGKVRKNDLFTVPDQGLFARITADPTENDELAINAWPGTDLVDADYEIISTYIAVDTASRTRELLLGLSLIDPNYDVQVNTLPDRAAYDNKPGPTPTTRGFAVLVSDIGDGSSAIYSKKSNATADWSDPAPYSGPTGAKGWSPQLVAEADGVRRVLKLAGYVGGEGTEPTDNVGEYLKADGTFTATIGDAVDIRGEGFVFRGAYGSGTAYVKNDVAREAGSSWILTAETSTGNAPPTFPTTSNAYWELLAQKGQDGTGTGDVAGPAGATDGRLAAADGPTGKLIKFLTSAQSTAGLDAVIGDSGSGGTKGLVPAPAAGDAAAKKFLRADGAWAPLSVEELEFTVSQLALGMADALNVAQFLGPTGNRLADSFDTLTYVDVAGGVNLDTSVGGLLKPTRTSDTFATMTDPALTTNAAAQGNIARRQVITAAGLTDVSGNAVRVTFAGPTTGNPSTISGAYFGLKGAVAPNFDGNQVPLTFGGNAGGVAAVGGVLVSDPIPFALDGTKDVVISFNLSTGSDLRYAPGVGTGVVVDYSKSAAASEIGNTTVSGYTSSADQLAAVDKIEVRTATGVVNNLTVRSTAFTSAAVPTKMKALINVKEVDPAAAGTDYTLECSRDSGTTWTTMALTERYTMPTTGLCVVEAAETDVSGQPSGTAPRWRFKTLNNKNVELHDVYLYWS